jgi:hypothetical protein
MQAKKKNRKNAKVEAEKRQVTDEDDAVLEAALGEKQRLLTAIERKREDAMGQDFARRLQEEEWAAADAGAAAVSRNSAANPAHSDGDAELAAAIALSLGAGADGVTPSADLRTAQDQEYAEALARDLQRQTEVVRASTASGDEELRLMRERRARAAEARLKQHQASTPAEPTCSQCGEVLGAERFSRDEKTFCSTSCVRVYASQQ